MPAPKKSFSISVGRKNLKPEVVLLGCPIVADAKGHATDVPLALHFIELLARLKSVHASPTATKVLTRLYAECDEQGVWHPHNLRVSPKVVHKVSAHMYPLQDEAKSVEGRAVDVTFRLALVAKLMGMQVEVV